jgi:predicted Ser/Thr protein kinase
VGSRQANFEAASLYILPDFHHQAQCLQHPRMTPAQTQLAERIQTLNFSGGELLGQSNQGEVRRFVINGQDLAIKAPKGRGLAWSFRQATLVHEYRAYQRLAGLPGFATCHGLFDRQRLVLDFVHGQPFRDASLSDHEHFFDQLLMTILAMHERGVAHGDLKRKDNLLVAENGRPVILDLGAATLRKSGWHPLNRRLFEFICQTDLNAWVKLKYGGYQGVSDEDLARLRRSGLERLLARMRRR